MKNVVLIVLLASVSVWSIADNHGGSGKGRKGGLFKQMDADGDKAADMEVTLENYTGTFNYGENEETNYI